MCVKDHELSISFDLRCLSKTSLIFPKFFGLLPNIFDGTNLLRENLCLFRHFHDKWFLFPRLSVSYLVYHTKGALVNETANLVSVLQVATLHGIIDDVNLREFARNFLQNKVCLSGLIVLLHIRMFNKRLE